MQETQDNSYRESTIVSPRRATPESRDGWTSWTPTEVVGDRITLSETPESAPTLSESEARKQEWLNSQRGKGTAWSSSQLVYRPQTIMLTGNASSSAFCHVALNAAAGWDRTRR